MVTLKWLVIGNGVPRGRDGPAATNFFNHLVKIHFTFIKRNLSSSKTV